MKLVSTLALLLWTSCYLNCSLEQSGVCVESLFSSSASDHCPHDDGDDAPRTCADDEFILLSQAVSSPEMPVKDLNDQFDLLVRLLAEQAQNESLSPTSLVFSDPQVSLSEQDCIRVSRPIRGPNV